MMNSTNKLTAAAGTVLSLLANLCVVCDVEQVAAYLDDAIVFNSDPTTHVKTIRTPFERLLRKHNPKPPPSKAR